MFLIFCTRNDQTHVDFLKKEKKVCHVFPSIKTFSPSCWSILSGETKIEEITKSNLFSHSILFVLFLFLPFIWCTNSGFANSLTQLESLELRDNALSELPESIRRLTKLERLDIGDNKIVSLPSELGYLSSLQELFLDSNQIQRLPADIGRLANLKCLDVSGNE